MKHPRIMAFVLVALVGAVLLWPAEGAIQALGCTEDCDAQSGECVNSCNISCGDNWDCANDCTLACDDAFEDCAMNTMYCNKTVGASCWYWTVEAYDVGAGWYVTWDPDGSFGGGAVDAIWRSSCTVSN